ncbi:hypothetical protein BGX26_007726, partial [Mortierella sp. AD094]
SVLRQIISTIRQSLPLLASINSMRVRPAAKRNWAVVPLLLGIGAVLSLSSVVAAAEGNTVVEYL